MNYFQERKMKTLYGEMDINYKKNPNGCAKVKSECKHKYAFGKINLNIC